MPYDYDPMPPMWLARLHVEERERAWRQRHVPRFSAQLRASLEAAAWTITDFGAALRQLNAG